ncbi:plasmid mobilization relaxosome protein MobC [Cyclobacterium marinum]|nr:plasmid mobilization relaxosome protein MobC [Cyclobacterium marinum]
MLRPQRIRSNQILYLQIRLPKARTPILEKQTYQELKKIGTNLNQIAKHYNSNIPVPSDKLTTFFALHEKLNLLIKHLVDDH